MMTHCDMCGKEIKDKKCSCGTWKENTEDDPMRKALEAFHELKQFTLTGDAPHLGCAVIFFRGDYVDCKQVEAFIHKMKKRPYYGDDL